MKTFLQMYPMMPAESAAHRVEARPLGRNAELYHETVHGLVEIAQAAEDLGYWGISFVEHHLHSEGFELAPAPGLLDAWVGAHTKRINLGQLGYVMSTHNPIRVAEETAVLDHLLKGRLFVGFARGYQSRWIRTLGQHYDAPPAMSQDDEERAAADAYNARLFREMVTIVKRAWTEDSFRHDGEFFKIPYPIEGIEGYPGIDAARRFGAPGEVDDQGRIQQVSVVPAPHQRPHPPVFISSSNTLESSRWAGEQGFNVGYFAPLEVMVEQAKAYCEGAEQAGLPSQLGNKQGLLRFVVLGETREEAYEHVERTVVAPFAEFYSHFFPKIFQRGGETPVERALNSGILFAGTVDDVRRQLAESYEKVPFEYFAIVSHYALEPKHEFIRDIELFATKVLTDFD